MLKKINQTLSVPFQSKDALLAFYQQELPKRVGNFRLDEVGPIMSVGSEKEIEGYLTNKFYFNGIGIDMGEEIDWYGTPNGDLEWNGGLVRQGHFMYLADAYTKTGNEKYAQTIINQMLDYIHKNPPYNPEGKPYLEYKKSTWRPFEVAGRAAENWPVALAQIINSSSMTANAFSEIFYSIYEHAQFLLKHHWRTGNHACLEVSGLGVLSIFYREFKDADGWRTYAVHFLMEMLDQQFYKDGYTKEMSGAYHWIAMRNFFAFYQVGMNNGFAEIFPKKYIDVVTQAAWAEFYQQKPDYSLPVTNDSNVTTQHKKQLEQLSYLINKEIIDYRIRNTDYGETPPDTSHFFKDARVAIMRSDWSKNAVYASIDMGRWGTNHMNEDQLNLEISAYGRNLLVNCGRWRYTTSPGVEWLSKAQYFKKTAAYNSLLCDGYSQMPKDADGQMMITEQYDYAKGVFTGGYGREENLIDDVLLKQKGLTSSKTCMVKNTKHTREVFFAKPTFFIVKDTVTTNENHTATQVWHMAEGKVSIYNESCVYSNFNDANFIMVQLGNPSINVYKGSEIPFKGWNCPKYDYINPAPEIDFTLEGDKKIVFETLIYPVCGRANSLNLPVFKKTITQDDEIYTVSYNGKTTKISTKGKWKLL